MISLFSLAVSPPKVWNKWGGGNDNKKVMETLFGDKSNFVRKTMCETIPKIAL